jgi:hypothetical protein
MPLDDIGTFHLNNLPREWAVCKPESDSAGFVQLRELVVECREVFALLPSRDAPPGIRVRELMSTVRVDDLGTMDLVPFLVAVNDLAVYLSRPRLMRMDPAVRIGCLHVVQRALEFVSNYPRGASPIHHLGNLPPAAREGRMGRLTNMLVEFMRDVGVPGVRRA